MDDRITERISKPRGEYKRHALEEHPDTKPLGGLMEWPQAI
jgi:hypothetical protein